MAFKILTGEWAGSGYQGRLIAEIDDIPTITASTGAINVTVRWHVEFSANTWDTSNILHTWGSWPDTSGVANVPSATTKQWNIRVQTISISPKFGSEYGLHVRGTLSGINNLNGGVPSLDQWVAIPSKPYLTALSPTNFNVVMAADKSKVDMSWTDNGTDNAGATPWSNVLLERWDNVSNSWTPFPLMGWYAVSYTDSNIVGDRKFQYRVAQVGPGGQSGWTYSSFVYSRPQAPTRVSALKQADGTIHVAYDKPSTIATLANIAHATNGVWDASNLSTGTPANPWVHNTPSAMDTHRYWVALVAPDGSVSAWSPASNLIEPTGPPGSPDQLSPNSVTRPPGAGVATWRHNPIDGTPQSQWEVSYRTTTNGGVSWTNWSSATGSSSGWPFTFGSARLVQWQVRTKGAAADWSAWSPVAWFGVASNPVVTISSPTSGEALSTDSVTVVWSSSKPQSSFTARLKLGSEVREVLTGTTASTAKFTTRLVNLTDYTVVVEVMDSDGLIGSAERAFRTSYPAPAPPISRAHWEADSGVVIIDVDGGATAASVVIDRLTDGRYVRIGTSGRVGTVVDYIPTQGSSTYRVTTNSNLGTSSAIDLTIPTPNTGDWIWVNFGADWSGLARARLEATTQSNFSRDRQRHHFAGRTRKVTFINELREKSVSVRVLIEESDSLGCRAAWERAVDVGDVVWYRDHLGRRMFASLDKVSFSGETNDLTELSFTVEEEDGYGE